MKSSEATLKARYFEFVKETLDELQLTIQKKNEDYSYGDNPFANFNLSRHIGIDPLANLFLRMQDKSQRIRAYLRSGALQVDGEGIEDAFLDTIGYSLLALGMIHFGDEGQKAEPDS